VFSADTNRLGLDAASAGMIKINEIIKSEAKTVKIMVINEKWHPMAINLVA